MNHIHRICRSPASLTRRAGVLVARRAAVPAAAARHPGRTAPLDHAPAGACPEPRGRHLRAAPRRATAPAAGKAAHGSRARPAAAHHPGVHPLPPEPGRVLGQPHRRQDGAQALVPVLLRGTGPGPLRHDPVRELARCHAGHDAQVPAPRHADPGSPAEKAGVRADPPHLRWSQPGIGDAAPGPCRAAP